MSPWSWSIIPVWIRPDGRFALTDWSWMQQAYASKIPLVIPLAADLSDQREEPTEGATRQTRLALFSSEFEPTSGV